jgi:hypothetical protein
MGASVHHISTQSEHQGQDHRAEAKAVAMRKPYEAPRLIHEAELVVRAGSPIFGAPDDNRLGNPWDPGYGQASPNRWQ